MMMWELKEFGSRNAEVGNMRIGKSECGSRKIINGALHSAHGAWQKQVYQSLRSMGRRHSSCWQKKEQLKMNCSLYLIVLI